MTTTHECPDPTCTAQVAAAKLACLEDWRRVPEPLQHALNKAWDHGRGKWADAHLDAMLDVVNWLKANPNPARDQARP